LQARGGITVGIVWADGALVSATLTPRFADTLTVRCHDRLCTVDTVSGVKITLTPVNFSEGVNFTR